MNQTFETAELDVGSLLRLRREELGIPLEAIAEKTRIRRAYLVALEENRFDVLPASTYLSGFLRSYAGALGLDPDGVLRRLRAQADVSRVAGMEPVSSCVPEAGLSRRQRRPLLFALLAALVAAAGLLYGLSGHGLRSDASMSPLPSDHVPPPSESPAPGMAESGVLSPPTGSVDADTENRAVEPAAAPPALPPIPAAGGVVRLEACAPVALEVEVDSRLPQRYDLTAESSLHWKVSRRFRLTADPPQAIALWLDEAPIPLAGASEMLLLAAKGDGEEVPR